MKKAIVTNEDIESLTKEDIENIEQWQVATLDSYQVKRIIQKAYEYGIELSREDKIAIGVPLTGAEVGNEIVSTIIKLALMFAGVVLLWWILF